MSNTIKYSGTTEGSKLNIGKWRLDGGGPTEVTDYWNGIDPPSGGYTIYKAKEENGPSIRLANNNAECLKIFNDYGFTGNTIEDGLLWASDQDDLLVINDGFDNIVTDGLVLYLDAAKPQSYPGSGTVWSDLSGNDNDGTLVNGPTFDSGNLGSIVFDGVDDYVSIPNSPSLELTTGSTFTISYIIKLNRVTGAYMSPVMKGSFPTSYGHLIGSSNNFLVYTDSDSGVELNIGNMLDGDVNTWVNIVQTYDGTSIKVYRNTILEGTSGNVTLTTNTYPLYIGSNNGTTYFLDGDVAQVKMYNRVLSAAEVLQNYNATRSRYGLP